MLGLALTFNAMGDRDEAVKLQKECADIRKRSLPEQHPDTGISLVNLGRILCDKGDFRNALVHVESGLAILQKKDPTSSLTAHGLYWLGKCKRGLAQLPEAYQHISECLSLWQAIYPEGHKDTSIGDN